MAKAPLKKDTYHHGNLRTALIYTAIRIINDEGIEALSLRSVAKATGVTQAAPYSHFRNKTDLLAAVAEAGFQRLALTLADAATAEKENIERLRAILKTYLEMATARPALYRLMFSDAFNDLKDYPTLGMSAGKCYSLVSTTLSLYLSDIQSTQDPRMAAAVFWSTLHGSASLIIDQKLTAKNFNAEDLDQVADQIVNLFKNGL